MTDDDDGSNEPIPEADVGGALILLAIMVALVGFLCWRIWPFIAHAGM